MTSPRLFSMVTLASCAVSASAAPPIVSNITQFTTGGITVTTPLDGNREVAGPKTTAVIFSAPVGTFTPLKPLTIDVVVFVHDAAGVVQATVVFPSVVGGTVNSAVDGSLASTTIDFSVSASPTNLGINLNTAIITARALVNAGINVSGGGPSTGFGIGIVVNDSTLDGADGAETLLNLTDEALDTVIDADSIGPVLAQVIRDTASIPQRMILFFDVNVANSIFTNLTNVDFESSTTSGGIFAAFTIVAFLGNPVLQAENNRAMSFPITPGQANLAPAVGNFVRIALTGTPGMNIDLMDLASNPTIIQPAILVQSLIPPNQCLSDLNGDGVVDSADLANLLAVWGASGVQADLNGDSVVNSTDLATLLANWGQCV